MRLEDIVDAERLEALYRPIGEAYGLPGAVYGQAFYELENRYVFPRGWAAVGVGGEIPDPGDAVPVMLGDWPLILLRNQEGRINVFHNVCRHRGMRVLPALCRGRKALKCPWHSWTYDLDGKRIATPDIGGPGVDRATGVARGIDGLVAARVALWHDFIFVNIGGNAPPFEEYRRPIDDLFADYELSNLRYAGVWECIYDGNWKVSMEGAVEDYHARWGHPQLWRDTVSVEDHVRNYGHVYAAVVSEVIMREDVEDKRIYNRALPTLSKPGVAANGRAYVANLFPTGHRHRCRRTTSSSCCSRPMDGTARGSSSTTTSRVRRRSILLTRIPGGPSRTSGSSSAGRTTTTSDTSTPIRRCATRSACGPASRAIGKGAVQHFQKMVVETIQEGQKANR